MVLTLLIGEVACIWPMLLFQVQYILLQATNLHMHSDNLTLVKPGSMRDFQGLVISYQIVTKLWCLFGAQASTRRSDRPRTLFAIL